MWPMLIFYEKLIKQGLENDAAHINSHYENRMDS